MGLTFKLTAVVDVIPIPAQFNFEFFGRKTTHYQIAVTYLYKLIYY